MVTVTDQSTPTEVLPAQHTTDTTGATGFRPVRLLRQTLLLLAAAAVYFGVRSLTEADPSRAMANAADVVRFEQWIGIFHETELQQRFADSTTARTVLNWVYIWGHWPVIAITLLWLALCHPQTFRLTRNAMVISGGIGLFVFALYPLAPPRLTELGMTDTVTETSNAYRVLQPPMFTNQYAAMPSLHVGWNLLMGIAIVMAARWWWLKLLGVLSPLAMTAAVVLTANHYIVDAVAGVLLVTAVWLCCRHWARWSVPLRSVIMRRSFTQEGEAVRLTSRSSARRNVAPTWQYRNLSDDADPEGLSRLSTLDLHRPDRQQNRIDTTTPRSR